MSPVAAPLLLEEAVKAGVDFFAGVPCSFLSPLITAALARSDVQYVAATSEAEAVGICAGACLAGRRTGVLLQASGLADALNPLTSLNVPFGIPTLLFVSARGAPDIGDEPQHRVLGANLTELLRIAAVRPYEIPAQPELGAAFARIAADLEERHCAALIVRKDSFRQASTHLPSEERAHRGPGECVDLTAEGTKPLPVADAVRCIAERAGTQAALLATTGQIGRQLFAVGDSERCFYMIGSMGCASAVGLGAALNIQRPVVILDGDGATLMRLGNFATIGAQQPRHFIHIVLDNGAYETTGGQPSAAAGVDLPRVAIACGYRTAYSCDTIVGLARALKATSAVIGPILIRVVVGKSPVPARPNVPLAQLTARFERFLRVSSNSLHNQIEHR